MCPLGEQEDYFLTVFSPWVEGPIYLSLVGVSQIGWKKYLDLGVVSSRASLRLSTLLERRKSIEKLKLANKKYLSVGWFWSRNKVIQSAA